MVFKMDKEVNYELYYGVDSLDALINIKTCSDNDARNLSTSADENVNLNVTGSEVVSSADYNHAIKLCGSSPVTAPIDLKIDNVQEEKEKSKISLIGTKVHPYYDTGPYMEPGKTETHKKKCFRCPHNTCKRMFHLKAFYKSHLLLHQNKRLECKFCQKVYKDKNQLSKHYSLHEDKDGQCKSFHCSITDCYYICLSDTMLREHEAREHGLQVQLYTCDQCSKTFKLKHSYIKHTRNHNSSRTYGCSECGKYFKSPDELKLHEKIHRHTSDYVCQLCGLEFKKSGNLKRHQNIHTGKNFFCDICFANFNHARSLTVHVMKNHPNARKKQLEAVKNKKIATESRTSNKRKFIFDKAVSSLTKVKVNA